MYLTLAHRRPTFTADMTTYYCHTLEEALKRAKKAEKRPGCYFGGITLRSGRRGFAVYRDGKRLSPSTQSILGRKRYREGEVIEQYSVIGRLV